MSKSLVMNFLNAGGKKTAIRISNVKDTVTEVEVAHAMDVILAKNIFTSTGGDLKVKDSAQIVDKESTDLIVK